MIKQDQSGNCSFALKTLNQGANCSIMGTQCMPQGEEVIHKGVFSHRHSESSLISYISKINGVLRQYIRVEIPNIKTPNTIHLLKAFLEWCSCFELVNAQNLWVNLWRQLLKGKTQISKFNFWCQWWQIKNTILMQEIRSIDLSNCNKRHHFNFSTMI